MAILVYAAAGWHEASVGVTFRGAVDGPPSRTMTSVLDESGFVAVAYEKPRGDGARAAFMCTSRCVSTQVAAEALDVAVAFFARGEVGVVGDVRGAVDGPLQFIPDTDPERTMTSVLA